MINKPPPFKGLHIRIPTIIPIKGRGFINQGSGLDGKDVLRVAHTWNQPNYSTRSLCHALLRRTFLGLPYLLVKEDALILPGL